MVTEVKETRVTGQRGDKKMTKSIEKWKIIKERLEELKWKEEAEKQILEEKSILYKGIQQLLTEKQRVELNSKRCHIPQANFITLLFW